MAGILEHKHREAQTQCPGNKRLDETIDKL